MNIMTLTTGGLVPYGDDWTYETIQTDPVNNIQFCSNWFHQYPIKSAREQVQDEILAKMAVAVEADDMKKARELVKLAKALKEL